MSGIRSFLTSIASSLRSGVFKTRNHGQVKTEISRHLLINQAKHKPRGLSTFTPPLGIRSFMTSHANPHGRIGGEAASSRVAHMNLAMKVNVSQANIILAQARLQALHQELSLLKKEGKEMNRNTRGPSPENVKSFYTKLSSIEKEVQSQKKIITQEKMLALSRGYSLDT